MKLLHYFGKSNCAVDCFRAYLLLIFLTLIGGCNTSVVVYTPKDPFMPLSVGNTWTYRVLSIFYDGTQYDDTAYATVLEEMTVTYENERYSAALVWGLYRTPTLGYDEVNWLFSEQEDGLYLMGGITFDEIMVHKSKIVQFPYEEGTVWQDSALYFGDGDNDIHPHGLFFTMGLVTIEVVATDSTITTPAGTFSCVVFHYTRRLQLDLGGYGDFYDYYSPGIGLIKQEMRYGAMSTSRELLDYTLK